jgi:hypothetical protein
MVVKFDGYANSTYVLNPNYSKFDFEKNSDINVTTPNEAGIYGNSSVDWSVTNSGSITGQTAVAFAGNATFDNTKTGEVTDSGAHYNAVWFGGVGALTNAGSITGVYEPQYGFASTVYMAGGGTVNNVATGNIYGGVALAGYGTVTNAGSITVYGHNLAAIYVKDGGQVNNSGYVTFSDSYGSGIGLPGGGTVTNSGVIQDTTGYGTHVSGIYLGSYGTATNSGTISLSLNDHVSGINLDGGGYALNTGTISISVYEHAAGIQLGSSGYVSNFGNISISVYQHAAGIELESGGTVSNSGNISIYATSHASGVYAADAAAAYVSNSGSISVFGSSYVSGIRLEAGGTFTNSGSVYSAGNPGNAVQFDATGSLDNQTGGSIVDVGAVGVYVDGSGGVSIVDHGAISGTYYAIDFNNAGASAAYSIVNSVTLGAGAYLSGVVQGSAGSYVTNDLILEGKGTLGSSVYGFQNLTVDKGAHWVLSGDDSFSSTIKDSGSLTVSASGALSGALTIEAGGVAIFDSSSDDNVRFAGVGELELKDPYTGAISGLVAGDSIDLLSHKFVATDHVKVVGDHLFVDNAAGAEITSITLGSSGHSASQFTLGADSAGHLLLTFK